MARISDLTYQKLAWCTNWYVRDETLKAATTRLVNFQYHQPLSQFWGSGTLSSSDGQRFPVSGKVRMATALPRYFGYGKGVTFYTWTGDQFSQYGTKVIPSTMRDAPYVLDEVLDNLAESHEVVQIAGQRHSGVLVSEDDWRAIQETLYLTGIPGMKESIVEGLWTPVDQCAKELDW